MAGALKEASSQDLLLAVQAQLLGMGKALAPLVAADAAV